ncbi:hypothetical protein QEM33_002906 [Pseudomonas putida]|nr:hypothetical protein [Pseudomonas putida]
MKSALKPARALIAVLSACALLSGCTNKKLATTAPPMVSTPATATATQTPDRIIEVRVDEFTKKTIYYGPETLSLSEQTQDGNSGAFASLYASKKGADTSYGLRFYAIRRAPASSGYLFIESAVDSNSMELPVNFVQRDVDCKRALCEFSENGFISISRQYLQSRAKTGIRVRLNGKRGSPIINVPASDVIDFLAKVPPT